VPFTDQEVKAWRERKEFMVHAPEPEEPEFNYYESRQEESTTCGIIFGICVLVCAIIYFIVLLAPRG
jgi:hypothetical protein